MNIFNRIRWVIPYNRKDQMLYMDDDGNEWPLTDPTINNILSQPLGLSTLILYLPNPITGENEMLTYTHDLTALQVLSAVDAFYNREITPQERQLALDNYLDEVVPELNDPNALVWLSDFLGATNMFEGFARYDNGWRPIFGY